jgi:FK506-binding nuclear protein
LDERNRNAALVQALLGKAEGKGRTVQGVQIEDLKVGTGKVARNGAKIKMCYVGKLQSNGKTFDACTSAARPFAFKLGKGDVIRGWDIGCEGMLVGGKRRLTIPPEKAYGQSGAPPTIPGNATLVFDVTLIDC